MERKKTLFAGVLLALVLAVAIVGATMAFDSGQGTAPPLPQGLPDDTQSPAPTPVKTLEEIDADVKAAQLEWETHEPMVAGEKLTMPDDAKLEGIVERRGPATDHHDKLEPLDLPVYIIVRDREVAMVSVENGEFQIGEKHKSTFQFLIDQLGETNMQLIPTDFYEKRWGLFRPKD